MIDILEIICIFSMFLVGVLFPLGMMIYMIVIFIKEETEINKLIKKSSQLQKFDKRSKTMFELVSYCVIGGCLVWTLGLMFFLCIESTNDEAELEEICHRHAMKEWQKEEM